MNLISSLEYIFLIRKITLRVNREYEVLICIPLESLYCTLHIMHMFYFAQHGSRNETMLRANASISWQSCNHSNILNTHKLTSKFTLQNGYITKMLLQ